MTNIAILWHPGDEGQIPGGEAHPGARASSYNNDVSIGGFKRRIKSAPVFSTCDPKGSDCNGALVAVWCAPYSFGELVQSGCNVVARNRHQIISRRNSRSQGPCRRWDRARNSRTSMAAPVVTFAR